MSATPKTSQPQSSKSSRKSRAARRPRRALASSDEDADIRRAHSSDSDDTSTVSDSDTLSSSEDAPNTPAPPATSTDHSVSPPSARRSKKVPKTKPDESLIPAQPTSWSELVNQEDGLHSSEPPIIDFADFVSTGVAGLDATPGPSRTEPKQEGGEREPAPVRGRSKPRGGKTHRQAYLERLSEDPSFIPRVGTFWGHDERLLAPELRGMSDWWRGRWNGRGRGGRGRGAGRFANGARPERTTDQDTPEPAPSPPPIERTWGHDGFEKMKDQERERAQGQPRGGLRGRGRGRGRGGRGGFIPRHPESVWTKAPDAYLYSDSSTRPQFPGQARVIKVNLPGQWRPSIVRLGRNTKPTPARASPRTAVEVPAEIVVKLPGKPAKVVPVSDLGPPAPVKPALPEEPETVQPLQDVPPKVVTRLPGANAGTTQAAASTVPQAPTAAPKLPTTEFIPRPAPTSALPAQVLQQTTPAPPPKPIPQIHGRTRSQLDAVAFARPSAAPATEPSVPLAFGSFESPPLAPGSAPPPENYAAPSPTGIEGPASAPLPSNNAPSPPPFSNAGPAPTSIRPPLPPPMASFTPPPANAYYNPYAYTPLDGATYYSTATPPPPPPHGMYYPTNGFFMPPRPRGPVSIRAPGESPSVGVNGGEERAPVPPMWNYYPPHPHSHTHSHSHSHGHNQYYSPSGTPYPPPPGPPQPGYYPGVGEYPGVYDYGNGGMYY